MDDNVKKSWATFLNPEILRSNLIVASIYIAAFEMLKDCIIDRPKSFFTHGFNENGLIVSDEYKKSVLSKNKDRLYASLLWLQEMSAINKSDLEQFETIKKKRNDLAHEMPKLLQTELVLDIQDAFYNLTNLLRKIGVWWIREVEIPTDPDFDDREVGYDGIMPGPIITLKLMLDIALGSKEESEFYFKEFVKRTN